MATLSRLWLLHPSKLESSDHYQHYHYPLSSLCVQQIQNKPTTTHVTIRKKERKKNWEKKKKKANSKEDIDQTKKQKSSSFCVRLCVCVFLPPFSLSLWLNLNYNPCNIKFSSSSSSSRSLSMQGRPPFKWKSYPPWITWHHFLIPVYQQSRPKRHWFCYCSRLSC